ncbi:hypothetical protein TNCV_233551 [Trichonephila clavipes]|nr:hypothetical protein TNCV_233551 [Trichonephila clavipes]
MWLAEWNEVFFTDESRICLQHHDGRTLVWRYRGEDAEQLRYAPPHWSCTRKSGQCSTDQRKYHSANEKRPQTDNEQQCSASADWRQVLHLTVARYLHKHGRFARRFESCILLTATHCGT